MFRTWLLHLRDIYYRKIKYRLNRDFRKQICECCGIECYSTQHHWMYAFTEAEVNTHPELALMYTSELCRECHMIADAITRLDRSPRTRVYDLLRIRNKKIGIKNTRVERIVWRKECD